MYHSFPPLEEKRYRGKQMVRYSPLVFFLATVSQKVMFEAVRKLSSQGQFSMLAFDSRWFIQFRLLFQTLSTLDLSTGKGMAISIASVCIQLFERTTARFYPSQVTILHTSTLFRDWYEYYSILQVDLGTLCPSLHIPHARIFTTADLRSQP